MASGGCFVICDMLWRLHCHVCFFLDLFLNLRGLMNFSSTKVAEVTPRLCSMGGGRH